jgi:hypothetical protein
MGYAFFIEQTMSLELGCGGGMTKSMNLSMMQKIELLTLKIQTAKLLRLVSIQQNICEADLVLHFGLQFRYCETA